MIERFIKMFRCRLCGELAESSPKHVEDSFNAAAFELDEHSYGYSEHVQHLCSDGSIGCAFIAGFRRITK